MPAGDQSPRKDWLHELGAGVINAFARGAETLLDHTYGQPAACDPAAFQAMAADAAAALGVRAVPASATSANLTLRTAAGPVTVWVKGGPTTLIVAGNPARFAPGAEPDGLADYLLGRSFDRLVFGGWCRDRVDGANHYCLKAALPAAAVTAPLIAEVVAALAAEMASLLAELKGA